MNLKLNLLFAGAIVLALTNCAQHPEVKEMTTTSDTTLHALSTVQSESSIKQIIWDTSNVLATRHWDLPKDWENDWKNATEKNYKDTIYFDKIGASVVVTFSTLSKDTANFILKNVEVKILKSSKNYVFSATISEQYNMGSLESFNTYAMVDVISRLKEGRVSGTKLEGKSVVLYAKTGTAESF